MKRFVVVLSFMVLAALTTGCCRSRCEIWEDTKTCGRYMGKGLHVLIGQHERENEVTYAAPQTSGDLPFLIEEEECWDTASLEEMGYGAEVEEELLARISPGDPGSQIPGINGFADPAGELSSIFKQLYFETDKYEIKGRDNLEHIARIANYLMANPTTYVFIEGHADERGPAAYNLALGSRRANSVRSFLLQHGVAVEQIHTISYGKERPAIDGHDSGAWKLNRRAQFKVYED